MSDQGWAFPGTSRKAHYFPEDGRALCGKWASWGLPPTAFGELEQAMSVSLDDCATCRRRLDKRGVTRDR